MSDPAAVLAVDEVSVRHRVPGRSADAAEVLSAVSIELRAGEWLGLIGPNGAGKSTLLRSIVGLQAHDGAIRLADGREVSARDVAYVPQSPEFPPGMSVVEYVLLGRTAHLGWLARESRHDHEVVGDVLDQLGLGSFAEREVAHLSGGEAQRVVLARALAQQAPILLLDEPTSALDLGHQAAVLELVDGLRTSAGLSIIAAMHDLTTAARFCDRLVLIDRGAVVASGAPAEVFTAATLSSVYGTELMVREIEGDLVVLSSPRSSARRPIETDPT